MAGEYRLETFRKGVSSQDAARKQSKCSFTKELEK
jgi:hypothetical protein